ncbi:MAG TPA: hypothetical protein VEB23_14665 [Ramlibacter sp.]|nr:hypothetical protein [Ramlibacter sp.]
MNIQFTLLMALGLVSHSTLAQVQSPEPSTAPPAISASDVTGPVSPTDASGSSSGLSSGASGPMQSEAGAELRLDQSPLAGLKPVTQDDVTFLCGGVGEEEAKYMKQEAKGYDLMLTFAARDGSYLANVDVDIKDAKGNSVLQTACGAPIMLVDLPRGGTYRVRAETAGYELNRTVKVAAGEKKRQRVARAVLSWPQHIAEVGADSSTATGSSGANAGSAGSGRSQNNGNNGAR